MPIIICFSYCTWDTKTSLSSASSLLIVTRYAMPSLQPDAISFIRQLSIARNSSTLAKSPCLEELESDQYFGAGYFDSYQGENNWDEKYTALMEKESALVSRYYALSAPSGEYESGSEEFYDACFEEMAQVLVELNLLRREMAEYWGYDSYSQFATDFYHYRDYTVAEARNYLDQIREELVDIFCRVNSSGIWEDGFHPCTETQTYTYVREMAEKMFGVLSDAEKETLKKLFERLDESLQQNGSDR